MPDREKRAPPGSLHDDEPKSHGVEPAQDKREDQRDPSRGELEGQIEVLKDRLLRELAEQENIRMRTRRELTDAVRFAASDFAKDIVSNLENLRRAINSFPEDLSRGPPLQDILAGLKATESGFIRTLATHGIKRLDEVGEPFDPSCHEAMLLVEGSGKPAGTVLEVVEPGYLHYDRLLRPARVKVATSSGSQSKAGNGSV